MAIDRSNRLTALQLPWDQPGAGPAHHRLASLLRAAVNEGRLRPGDRLPPTRVLAEELAISRWVVTEAYDQLKAEGYLTARVGSGTVVAGAPAAPSQRAALRSTLPDGDAATSPSTAAPSQAAPSQAAPSTAAPSQAAPSQAAPSRTNLARSRAGASGADLSPALPDLASFPRPLWRTAITRALASAEDDELGHPDPAGSPRLRSTLAAYLRRVRGLDVDAGRVHVTLGVRNAVSLICRHLTDQGALRIAVEDPCWPRLREVAREHGLEVIAIAVDAEGMRVDDLVARDGERRVDAVFVTPTHQFPTGVPLSAARRIALLSWAGAGGRVVVEDDYDAEFRYDRRPVGALAALSGEHVVYLGSTSKTLSPSLHLGWMVAPGRLSPGLAATRDAIGAQAPTLDQLALLELVSSGAYDRHLRRMRRHYQGRRRALVEALAKHVPGRAASSMDAGLHVLWQLPESAPEAVVLRRCAERGLIVLGLSQCRLAAGPPGLVLGCGNVPEHRAEAVAVLLGSTITAV